MTASLTLIASILLAVYGSSAQNCNDNTVAELRNLKEDVAEELTNVIQNVIQIGNTTQTGLEKLEKLLQELKKQLDLQAVKRNAIPVSEWYEKMLGTAVATSGNPLGRRSPYETADNENMCQIRCDNAFPSCQMFAFSESTHQCILFDITTVSSPMPKDTTLYSYYQYTAVSHVTSAAYAYTMLQPDLTKVSWITFSLKACGDGQLFLQNTRSPDATYGYEFSIGGWWNSRTCLKRVRLGELLACANGRFLDCNYTRWFWISWYGGAISFGTGKVVGESVEFSYTDATPYSVKAIGLSGWWDWNGAWTIHIPKLN